MYRGATEKIRPAIDVDEKCSACGKKTDAYSDSHGWHKIAVYHCDDEDIRRTF
jgi:hypothetical protein